MFITEDVSAKDYAIEVDASKNENKKNEDNKKNNVVVDLLKTINIYLLLVVLLL